MEKKSKKEGKIPKILHYVWLGGKEKPDYLIKNLEGWKKFCPDYQIMEWNEGNFDINCNRYLKEAVEQKKWAFASDYIRLAVTYKYGGIYMDTDVELLKPIDKFLDVDFFANFENMVMISFTVIGAKPGSVVLKNMLSKYEDKPFILNAKRGKLDLTTNVILGSCMMKEDFGFLLNDTYQEKIIDGEKVVCYPHDFFFAQDYVSKEILLTENSHGVHLYASSWLGKKQRREDRFVENVRKFLGEKLFRKVMKRFLIARVKKYTRKYKKQNKKPLAN
ncbi:MAG: glycosyl transferase [Clostridia bacterium]|nr:glycosyl transferase [Clostridia bacterium]